MVEEFEYKGQWYLPEKPEKSIFGTLRFTPTEGAILDLMGSFRGSSFSFGRMLQPEIILGFSSNGKLITLYKCFETKLSMSSPGLPTSSFYANVVFVGATFQSKDDIKFKRMLIHYSNLDEWVNISGIDIQDLPDRKEVVIKYKRPEPIKVDMSDNYDVFLDVLATGPTHSAVQKEASIEQKTYVRIEPREKISFDEFLNIAYNIQNFLSLAFLSVAHPLIVTGIAEENHVPGEEEKNENIVVDIFYESQDGHEKSKILTQYDMLFTLGDLQGQLSTFLKNWFKEAELLKPVYDLYFGSLYNSRMYLQHRFLSFMQAIESYHRRTMNNFELPKEEHKKRISEIVSAVPEAHRNWIENKLVYSNELNLRNRFKELLDIFSDLSRRFIPDRDSFIHKVVTTRNYLTHYDEESKKQCLEGIELYRATKKLKILIEICLLKTLGFPSDKIKELVLRNTKYGKDISVT